MHKKLENYIPNPFAPAHNEFGYNERPATTNACLLHSVRCKPVEVFNFHLAFSGIILSQFIPTNFTFNKLGNMLCSFQLGPRIEL